MTAAVANTLELSANYVVEIHAIVKARSGSHFQQDIRPWINSIRSIMTREKCSDFAAFQRCCNRLDSLGHLSIENQHFLIAALAEVQTTRESEIRTKRNTLLDLRLTNVELFNAVAELDCQQIAVPKDIRLWIVDQLQEQKRLLDELAAQPQKGTP